MRMHGISLGKAIAIVLLVGWAPLLLYISFDALRGGGGNPIGLGLLMVASTVVALALLAAAVCRALWRRLRPRRTPGSS